MPTDRHYYFDWIDARTGEAKRLWIRPGSSATSRDLTGLPAWGADPAGGSNWSRLPDGFVKGQSTSAAEFDALRVGLPDPPTRTIKVDLSLLVGTSDWTDLAGYLTFPIVPDARTLDLSATESVLVDSPNLWTITTDRGEGSGGSFYHEFTGVQLFKAPDALEENQLTGEAILTVELVHFIRAALGTILPGWVGVRVEDSATALVRERIYNKLVIDGGTSTAHILGNRPTDDPRQKFHSYLFADWIDAVESLTSELLVLWGDLALATFEITAPAIGFDSVGPLAVYILRGDDYTKTGGADAGVADVTAARYCGRVELSDDPGTIVGGWHSDTADAASAKDWRSVWDIFVDLCSACWIRIVDDENAGPSARFEVRGLLESVPTGHTLADFRETSRKVELRKEVVTGATVDIPGVLAGDVGQIEYLGRLGGVLEDNLRDVPIVFHANPVAGERDGAEYLIGSIPESPLAAQQGIYVADVPSNLLFYEDTPTGWLESILVRFHSEVGVRLDAATSVELTTNPGGNFTQANPVSVFWGDEIRAAWDNWREHYDVWGSFAGIPFASARATSERFLWIGQAGVELTVPAERYALSMLGGSLTVFSGSDIVQGSYLSHLTRAPDVVGATQNEATGDVTLSCIIIA